MPASIESGTKIKNILNDRGITLERLSEIISEQTPGYKLGVDRIDCSRLSDDLEYIKLYEFTLRVYYRLFLLY